MPQPLSQRGRRRNRCCLTQQLRHNSLCIFVEGGNNVEIEGNTCDQQAVYNQTFYPFDPKQPTQPSNVTEPKGGIVLANNAELGTLDSGTVLGNIVKSNRLDNR